MSSFSAALALFLIATTLHSQTKGSGCPAYQQAGPLSAVDVFDGPPSERADLIPDVSRRSKNHAYASWNVASIYAAGRHVFLVCQYAGTPQKTVVEIPRKVDRCIYRTHLRNRLEITCK